jgi:polyisoprenoid-binding protein YceI
MRLLFLALLLSSAATAVAAPPEGASSASVRAQCELNPYGIFTVEGGSEAISGEGRKNGDEFVADKISVDLSRLKTGKLERDEHMRDRYLEIQKYPRATLIQAHGKDGVFQGELELHGVRAPISGTFEKMADGFYTARFKLKMSDFKIKKPEYLFVEVTNTVLLEVTVRVR